MMHKFSKYCFFFFWISELFHVCMYVETFICRSVHMCILKHLFAISAWHLNHSFFFLFSFFLQHRDYMDDDYHVSISAFCTLDLLDECMFDYLLISSFNRKTPNIKLRLDSELALRKCANVLRNQQKPFPISREIPY